MVKPPRKNKLQMSNKKSRQLKVEQYHLLSYCLPWTISIETVIRFPSLSLNRKITPWLQSDRKRTNINSVQWHTHTHTHIYRRETIEGKPQKDSGEGRRRGSDGVVPDVGPIPNTISIILRLPSLVVMTIRALPFPLHQLWVCNIWDWCVYIYAVIGTRTSVCAAVGRQRHKQCRVPARFSAALDPWWLSFRHRRFHHFSQTACLRPPPPLLLSPPPYARRLN